MRDGVVPFWLKSLAPLSPLFSPTNTGMEERSESRGREKDRRRRRRRRDPSESFTDDQGIHRGRERTDRYKREVVKMPKARATSPPSPGSGVGSGAGSAWGKPAAPPTRRMESPAPSESPKGVVDAKGYLGRTSGIFAAGAWAARMEIAKLLESRCNPNDLVAEIKGGVEGLHDLESKMHTASKSTLDNTSEAPKWSEVLDDPLDEEIEKQKAILESITQQQSLPPWIDSGGGPPSAGGRPRSNEPTGEMGFVKRAVPPPPGFKRCASPPLEVVERDAEISPREFAKAAKPPTERQREEAEKGVPGAEGPRKRTKLNEDSLAEREKIELENFFQAAKNIFDRLKEAGVRMDLAELTSCPDGGFDEARFRMHVAPNKARTGMRYARLLQAMFEPKNRDRLPYVEKEEPFEKLNCLGYMEAMVQSEVGRRTPQAFLYAVDFFAKAFGFSMGGGHVGRAKRLALRYAQLSTLDRKGAPMFNRLLMETLERIILDPVLPSPQRIAAGKLRICIQASIRHDDLTSTPLGACEWVRRRGEVHVVGLRARAWKGKTHARAWVCSSLGVVPEHDKWLQALMPLLVESHGPEWKQHDHLGKMPSGTSAEAFLARPATIESDVLTVKTVLSKEQRP